MHDMFTLAAQTFLPQQAFGGQGVQPGFAENTTPGACGEVSARSVPWAVSQFLKTFMR